MRVAVLGGGISGLASARRLRALGHEVTLYEAEPGLGGLATTFAYEGLDLEKFYHCLLPADQALLAHVHELGLDEALRWKPAKMGFRYQERTWPLNTPLDLLRFGALRWHERLRLGLLAVRARLSGTSPALDELTAADWLRSTIGERCFEVLWKPLLAAKIGDHYAALPALWLSSRMHREKNVAKEEKGFLVGGYRGLIDRFEDDLRESGVVLRMATPVSALEEEGAGLAVCTADGAREAHDCVVSTLPLPLFQRIGRGLTLPDEVAKLSLDYQGVVSGVFLTREPLSPYYWAPWVDCGATSQGLVAMSALLPPELTGGLHVNYLVNYTHRDGELYAQSDEQMLEHYRRDLERIHGAAAQSVEASFVFRAPFVEPMWTVGYASEKPPFAVRPGRLYLACTAQLYPRVNSWNACCEMVDEMIECFREDTRHFEAAA